MSRRDQNSAVEHGALLTDESVGDPAARQRHHVHHRGVQPVDGAALRGTEPEPSTGDGRRHEQQQQRAHAVVAEPLPHFREKERGQPARMTKEGSVVFGNSGGKISRVGSSGAGVSHARSG
jgi:hypothetical protein